MPSVLPLFLNREAELRNEAQAEVVVRVRRRVVVAIRAATVGSVVVPATPTIDTIGACTLRKHSEDFFAESQRIRLLHKRQHRHKICIIHIVGQ